MKYSTKVLSFTASTYIFAEVSNLLLGTNLDLSVVFDGAFMAGCIYYLAEGGYEWLKRYGM